MSTEILSLDQLKSISKYTNGIYDFDLSSIYVDFWEPLKDTLYELGIKKLPGIGFNFNTLVSYNNAKRLKKKQKFSHPPIELEGSIQKNVKELIPELVGLLSRVIPRTKTINSLYFTAMPFGMNEIEILSVSIQQCSCLRTLSFTDIPLYDNGFAKMCEALNRQTVQRLTCRNCGLSDEIAPIINCLAETHTVIQKAAEKKAAQNNEKIGLVCLHIIDLSNNNFTSQFVEDISSAIDDSPIATLDLSGNNDVDPAIIQSSKILFDVERDDANLTPAAREAELIKENERLRKVISQLIHGKSLSALRSDLYAVGPRSEELAEHIKVLDELCAAIGSDPSYTPRLKKGSKKKSKK